MTCELDTVVLMSEPFSLYYGDSVSARIRGSNQDGALTSGVGTSEDVLAPYIAGQIEFGYHQYGYYPFDEENGAYPTDAQLAELDIASDLNLTTIRIQERTTTEGHLRLHGIQLAFANGAETPFFKGMDTGQEETVVSLDVDPTREISGISMKSWRDTLSGLRLVDEEGDYIVDYTWQPTEESGAWSEVQRIPKGQSIVGLMVNEPQVDIYRVAFLLWERFPDLDADIDLN